MYWAVHRLLGGYAAGLLKSPPNDIALDKNGWERNLLLHKHHSSLTDWEREKGRPNVLSSMATSTTPPLINSEQFKSSASILRPLPLRFTAANTKNHCRVRCALSTNNWRDSRRLFSISLVLSNLFLIPDRMLSSVHRIVDVGVSSTWRTNSMNKSLWIVFFNIYLCRCFCWKLSGQIREEVNDRVILVWAFTYLLRFIKLILMHSIQEKAGSAWSLCSCRHIDQVTNRRRR